MDNNGAELVIGIIDSYGAIEHRAIKWSESGEKTHFYFWPTKHHKRWRFVIKEWELSKSCLSDGDITPEEAEQIYARMRKYFRPPLWWIQGEEWEAMGRPHEGPEYERHTKRWNRIHEFMTRQGHKY